MFGGRHRAHRRAAWLALVALFLQVVVPALHHPASAAAPIGAIAAAFCVAPGSQAPAPSDTDKSPAHGKQACAICQTLHMLGGGFVPPVGVALAPIEPVRAISSLPPAVAVLDGRAVLDSRARAPPAKA